MRCTTRCKQRAVHCLYNENKHPTHTSKQRAVHYSTTRTNIGKRVSISPSPLHKLPHVPATLYLNTDRERTARCARGNPTKSLQRAVFSCQESPSRSASFPFRFGTLSATRARGSLTISERKTKISDFETEKCHIWLAMNPRFRLRGEDGNSQKK